MAGIADTETIDVIAQTAQGDFVLCMVEDRPWGADPAQREQLRQKINSYTWYILDGTVGRLHPETVGAPMTIQLNCVGDPPKEIAEVIEFARSRLDGFGIRFVVNAWDEPP